MTHQFIQQHIARLLTRISPHTSYVPTSPLCEPKTQVEVRTEISLSAIDDSAIERGVMSQRSTKRVADHMSEQRYHHPNDRLPLLPIVHSLND